MSIHVVQIKVDDTTYRQFKKAKGELTSEQWLKEVVKE